MMNFKQKKYHLFKKRIVKYLSWMETKRNKGISRETLLESVTAGRRYLTLSQSSFPRADASFTCYTIQK